MEIRSISRAFDLVEDVVNPFIAATTAVATGTTTFFNEYSAGSNKRQRNEGQMMDITYIQNAKKLQKLLGEGYELDVEKAISGSGVKKTGTVSTTETKPE